MLRLHGMVRSRAMRTLWLLEELEVEFEWREVGPRSPEAYALNPKGTIPILETDEGVILDSLAQMHFLADREGRFTHPAGSLARGTQDAMSFTVLEMLDAPLWAMALHGFGLPEDKRVPEVKDASRWLVGHNSTRVADLMDGPYAVGEVPTVADIVLAHCTGWARGLKIEVDERLRDHARMMRDRPAFQRAAARG
ncbi:glutathione S-transferase family protein [Jannaschia sp. Os4]|uniref:glutathione S-transferase family protein n=1 Tax=Jannaschia sp. Os4 TaxID=2807617 RepID=UPI00193A349A|nr:glutathione S-transferase family protein [Jannaschia sp. Os4]MBM2575050.1 glutathione S-transferase family protein [Jannaschia sp. Os4]